MEAEVVCVPPPPRRGPRWQRELLEIRHSRRLFAEVTSSVDLVWERHSLHSDGGWRFAASRGIPRLVEINAPLLLEREVTDPVGLWSVADRLERLSLQRCVRAVVVSHWLAPWARALGAPEVRVVPNGTSARPGRTARRPDADLVVGYVGSCARWHDLPSLPALLAQLPEATAIVVGTGPSPPPTHPRILHVPSVDDPMPWVRTFDVAIAPGRAPPWVSPLKLVDYRAAGVPIVSSDVGDSAQLVGAGGEVLSVGAPAEAWAQAIRRQHGREVAASVRSWDRVVSEALDGLSG